MKPFAFIGEKRSTLAVKRNVYWKDGRLAAKQLFDALSASGIDPAKQAFANLFEGLGIDQLHRLAKSHTVVGLGRKVQAELARLGINHLQLVHPAARGAIRKKHRYAEHVRQVLGTINATETAKIN